MDRGEEGRREGSREEGWIEGKRGGGRGVERKDG